MLAGVGAGVAGSLVACPTELIKCRLQAQSGPRPMTPQLPSTATTPTPIRYSGPLSVARHVMTAEGGARGLYRGLVPTFLREIPGNAAMFGTYAAVKHGLASAAGLSSPEALPKPAMLLAGGIAGAAFWLSCYPMDVVKSKIQTDSVATGLYNGTWDCIRKVQGVNVWCGDVMICDDEDEGMLSFCVVLQKNAYYMCWQPYLRM